MYPVEARQAVETADYRLSLILSLEDVSRLYSELLSHYAKVSENKELIRNCICKMVVLMNHLLPKLEGTGKHKELLEQFNEFRPWSDNILLPVNDTDELKKVHKLFRLILKAYDVLGLSNY